MKLYEIPASIRAVEDEIADQGGELTTELERRLTRLEAEFERKVEYLALLIREADVEAAAYKIEENRLRERRRAAENRAANLKRYIQTQMVLSGIRRVKGDYCSVSIAKNSRPSVTWTGEPEQIPEHLRRIKVEIDSTAVLQAQSAGEALPDQLVIEHGEHLRIR